MEYDKKTINIPEGYEIDFEATKKQGPVVLRKQIRPKNWTELTRTYKDQESFWYSSAFNKVIEGNFESCIGFGEFEDNETAEAFAALWKLLNYRKAWIGKWKPDWTNKDQWKYLIVSDADEIAEGLGRTLSRSLSFPTAEMRDEFRDSFKCLLEVAKPLL